MRRGLVVLSVPFYLVTGREAGGLEVTSGGGGFLHCSTVSGGEQRGRCLLQEGKRRRRCGDSVLM
jgi:hypothetical protein